MKNCQDMSPRDFEDIKKFKKKGLILVHTGDGKGKSTSAFGTALRAMGRGYKVGIVQFIKGNWQTGESKFFKKFSDLCDVFTMGDGFTWDTKNFDGDVKTAQRAWRKCCEILHDEKYQLVIFDEINYVMKYNFLSSQEVVSELMKKPELKHDILTGNGAPPELIELADLVTEMKCIKHPYEQGVKAQPGIEY
ncbi:MAG: cob(I)yrinic acid a,c-diamide adenosyltransferase [Omnitrophica WOR_2 bacterium RIFCSPHIGHO2_01_FULL_48_9]|nr:MAG: cob(I)yrinic acid a,c-diamide adenosyltransferase [Omnitrophica WOR_2 bacterium RIFCSPHIGHO2_01_FULL_48_9]